MALINFLEETTKVMKNHKQQMKFVRCIRNKEGYIPIADFEKQAVCLNYDNGPFGPQKHKLAIDPTLMLIGQFWWIERESQNGVEGWVYHHKPPKPTLPAGEVSLINTRNDEPGEFMQRVEKCGGYFDELDEK